MQLETMYKLIARRDQLVQQSEAMQPKYAARKIPVAFRQQSVPIPVEPLEKTMADYKIDPERITWID